MADTINYIRKEGQRKYVSDTEFTSLDKSSVPVGTEYNIVGEIEESDLSADLQTKINSTITATGNISISDGKIDTIDVPLFQSVMIGEEANNSILENSVSGSHIFRLPYITDGDTTLLSLATVHAGAGVQLTEELVGELTISTNIEAGDNISITKASDSKKVIISATGLVKQVGNTDTDLAYVHSAVIGETTFPITQSVVGSSIARRTNIGTIEANDPKDDLDCVNLQYAEYKFLANSIFAEMSTDEDLNDYNAYGTYGCSTDAVAKTIKNIPTPHAFIMWVFAGTGTGYPTQLFFTYVASTFFVRNYIEGNWHAWQQIASMSDITSAINGQSFKTINGNSITGTGNISIESGITGIGIFKQGTSGIQNYIKYMSYNEDSYEAPTNNGDILVVPKPRLKTINNTSILGTGNITTPDTNTAHTHSAGAGLTVSGSGGISGAVAYNLKVASASEIGGVKPGVTSGKTYGVSVDDSGAMTVSVPWENNTWPTAGNTGYAGINNTGTVTSVAVKMNGATKGTVKTSGTIDLGTVLTGVSAGDNIAVSGSTISVDINKDLNLNTHHLQFEGTGSNDEIAYIGYENGGYTIYGPQKKNATGNCYFPRNGGTLATTADLTNYVTTGSFASLAKRVTDLEALLNQEGYEVVLVKK